jgi:transcriptional activator SPT7
VETLDDEALFGNEDDEEEDGAFVMYDFLPQLSHVYGLKHYCRGGFTDAFGEDFLGLRELGIASEFGLSSLTIPKKLLKNKNKGRDELNATAYVPFSFCRVYILRFNSIKLNEPPPPYPPPPPFVPITPAMVDDQIGLLKPYYQSRLSALMGPSPMQPPSAPPAAAFGTPVNVSPSMPGPPPIASPPSISLLDDAPNPAQIKMGPIGQIVKGGPSAGATKKKNKAKEADKPPPQPQAKGGTGKKKVKMGEDLPPVIFANA